jgi:hypothetical protein
MRVPAYYRICSCYIFCSALAVAEAKKKPLFEDSATGAIAAIVNGKLTAIPDATVTLTCVAGAAPSESNHWRSSCDSRLVVERNGKTVATLASGIGGIDFEQVAGNGGSLSLSLLDVGAGSLVAVRTQTREGDEQMKESQDEQLFAVEGKSLREVFRWEPLRAFEPGPDGRDEDRQKTVQTLEAGPSGTLILDDKRLAWDGKQFAEVRVDPLVARVLAGKRLLASELVALGKDDLSKLRNAPYARHGRPFKSAELQSYFYRERKPDPAFKESMLDADDKFNLELVLAELKKR